MLRITVMAEDSSNVTLRLEGRLAGNWVTELQRECGLWNMDCRKLILDFSEVTFIDGAGARLLHRLRGEGVEIKNVSGLVWELIQNHGSLDA